MNTLYNLGYNLTYNLGNGIYNIGYRVGYNVAKYIDKGNNNNLDLEKSYIVINKDHTYEKIDIKDTQKDNKNEDNIKLIQEQFNKKELNEFVDRSIKKYGKSSASLKLRLKLWYSMFGEKEIGNCFCCLKVIQIDDPSWHCGHILAAANGGKKSLENLKPVCVKCNLDMRKQHMYQYMIYNDTEGITNLLNILYTLSKEESKLINKFRIMKIKYTNCLNILNHYLENKLMPKLVIEWFKREIKTEDEEHLNNTLNFLMSYQ